MIIKTPLRYPGGKSRAIKKMSDYLPDMSKYNEYRETFIGGGSFAIHIAQQYPKMNIWINDLYEPLYNFWIQLRDNNKDLQQELLYLKHKHNNQTLAKDLFLEAKDNISVVNDDVQRAVYFYILNKCSFSGLTESSSYSKLASDQNFTIKSINKLNVYQDLMRNWKITNLSYENLLSNDRNVFAYLDPPYDISSSLYGKKGSMHKSFDHDDFAAKCSSFTVDQMISYNADQMVKDRFVNWNSYEFDLTYTMRSVGDYMKEQKNRQELLLTNYQKNLTLEDLFC